MYVSGIRRAGRKVLCLSMGWTLGATGPLAPSRLSTSQVLFSIVESIRYNCSEANDELWWLLHFVSLCERRLQLHPESMDASFRSENS